MTTTQITRTETTETITYAAIIDGIEASFLDIDATTRKVTNIETLDEFARQGLARSLWEAANSEGECFHAVEHHRTPEGDAFAQAVGGETIAPELDIIDACFICCGDDEDEDEDDDTPCWM